MGHITNFDGARKSLAELEQIETARTELMTNAEPPEAKEKDRKVVEYTASCSV